MEPRPFRRGNNGLATAATLADVLQWSHVPSDVETTTRMAFHNSRTVASMEPRPFRRGNSRATSPGLEVIAASMEPRPFRRGNRTCQSGSLRTWKLQWSHVPSDVETPDGPPGRL